MDSNITQEKTYAFAIRIIKFVKYLRRSKKDYILSKQILRSGTSIGANVEEAMGSISRKEFIMKMQIAYKESRETFYWLKLIKDTDDIEAKLMNSILKDSEEVIKILTSLIKTAKSKNIIS